MFKNKICFLSLKKTPKKLDFLVWYKNLEADLDPIKKAPDLVHDS